MDTTAVLSSKIFGMSIFNLFAYIIAFIGFAGIVYIAATLIGIGRKLQILDDLTITIDKIKKNLKVVCDFLVGRVHFNPAEVQGYSPSELTTEGKEFISKSGFKSIFYTYKADFFSFIDSEKPKLKYDVEVASIKSVLMLSDKEYMGFLKIFFYNEPKRNMENTAPTLGVYIRDQYLAEHPEIIK